MIKHLKDMNASSLEESLNKLGPTIQILSIYAVNTMHFAWVQIPEAKAKKIKDSKDE